MGESIGDGEPEFPPTQQHMHFQRIISGHVDGGLRAPLQEVEGSWCSLVRLRELCSQDVDHTWIWKLNARRGPILHAGEFLDAVRFHLGLGRPMEPTV